MKRVLVFILMAGLGFLLAWALSEDTSQQKAELESVKTELQQLKPEIEKTESQRNELKVKIAVEQRDSEQLQEQVNELIRSRDQLQEQIEKFTFSREQSQQQFAEIIGTRDKLKKQVIELTGSRDTLQQQLTELTASHDQLSRQVDELTRSRNAAVDKAQTAQERIEVLVAMLDSETREFGERLDQLTVTNQKQEDEQPPMVEIKYPAASTEVIRPAVAGSNLGERPTCHSFNTTRPRILPGQTSTLSWQVSNADRIRIEPGIGPVSALGSRVVKPSTGTTYTLIATNKAGESRKTCRIEFGDSPTIQRQESERPAVLTEVIEPPVISSRLGERPTCNSFNTSRPRIMPGQSSTLSWQVSNARRIRIEPGIGPVSSLGSRAVNPSTTTTYTLIAENKAGRSRLSCRVEINDGITIFSSDAIHPRILLEEDKASGDRKVLPGQKTQVSDPNAKLGKFIGYHARTDESGKFIFIPVYENKKEE